MGYVLEYSGDLWLFMLLSQQEILDWLEAAIDEVIPGACVSIEHS